jgi:HEAT repeat protein
MDALYEIGSADKDTVVPGLIGLLEGGKAAQGHQSWSTVGAAAYVLGGIGRAAKEAIPALVKLMRREGGYPRVAADALGSMGAEAVPPLVEELRDPRKEIHLNAAEVLSRMEPEAQAAVPALIEALRDQSPWIAAHSADALRGIGPGQGRRSPG